MNVGKIILNLIIIILVSVLLIAMIETILRVSYPEKINYNLILNPDDLAYQNHKEYLVSLKPNVSKKFIRSQINGGDVITWHTNSSAFRGPELKTNPAKRIVVYGDSNIQARFSSFDNTFTSKLGNYLNEGRNSVVEVINAGIVGVGPDQSLIRLSGEITRLHPDLVVFHIFADNDFGDIIRNRIVELSSNNELIKVKHKAQQIDEQLSSSQLIFAYVQSLLIVRMAKKLTRIVIGTDSEAEKKAELIRQLKLRSELEFSYYEQTKLKHFSHFDDHYDLDVATLPGSKSSLEKLKLMSAVLSSAKTTANHNQAKFMVVIQPSVIDTTMNYLINYNDLKQFPEYRPINLTNAVKEACIANQIHYVNLFDTFLSNEPSSLFFMGGDNHWNDKGQNLAARETALFITANNLL